jgi:hypothetical protein
MPETQTTETTDSSETQKTIDVDIESKKTKTPAEVLYKDTPGEDGEKKETQKEVTQKKETTQVDEDKKSEDKDKEGDKDKEKVTEYSLKLPKDSLLKESDVKSAKDFAKELGLNNEQAQLLLDKQSKYASDLEAAKAKYKEDNSPGGVEWEKRVMDFEKELLKEKEFSTPEAIRENAESAKRAATEIGGEELVNLLNETGYGSNKVVMKALTKLGKMFAEDKLVMGDSVGQKSKNKSMASIMYPNTPGPSE